MILIGLCLGLSIAVFLFFKAFSQAPVNAFKDNSYTTEIMAAFLGTVFTIIITAILLRTQSVMEESKEKSVGIFQAKLDMYKNFMDFLNSIIDDSIIDDKELKELEKWVLKLSLVANDEVTFNLVEFVDQTIRFRKLFVDELSESDKEQYIRVHKEKYDEVISDIDIAENFITVGAIVGLLKKDLGEKIITDRKTLQATWVCIDDLLSYSKKERISKVSKS